MTASNRDRASDPSQIPLLTAEPSPEYAHAVTDRVLMTAGTLLALALVACAPLKRLEAGLEFRRQLATSDDGVVVLINEFEVTPDDAPRFVSQWQRLAAIMARQPGYISSRLHRVSEGSHRFLNYAVWKNAAVLKRALQTDEFTRAVRGLPARATPRLYRILGARPGDDALRAGVTAQR